LSDPVRTLEKPSPYTPVIAAPEGRGEAGDRRDDRHSNILKFFFVGLLVVGGEEFFTA